MEQLQQVIESAFAKLPELDLQDQVLRGAVETAINLLDEGKLRVAEKINGEWVTHQWLKKAVLLSFRLNDMSVIKGGPGAATWWDKVPSKFDGWGENRFAGVDRWLMRVPQARQGER